MKQVPVPASEVKDLGSRFDPGGNQLEVKTNSVAFKVHDRHGPKNPLIKFGQSFAGQEKGIMTPVGFNFAEAHIQPVFFQGPDNGSWIDRWDKANRR